jgi:outer membrane protein TolC
MFSFGSRFLQTLTVVGSLLLGIGSPRLAHAQNPGVAGTLPEDYLPGLRPILEAALKQSPQILLRQAELAGREARVIEADAERLPQVGGNLRYDSNRTSATASATARDNGFFYSLSANQSLFQWGAVKHRREIARIEVAVSQRNYAEAYRVLTVQLRQIYVQLIASNARLKQARFALDIRKADLATAKDRQALGTASAAEIYGRELDLTEAELEVERLQIEFDADRRRLSRLAGLSPDIGPEQIPSAIPETTFDAALADSLLAALLRDATGRSFRAQAQELRVKEADLNYRIARVRLLPRFFASMGHSRESSTTASATQVSQTAITRDTLEVRGEWSIFDGFATRGYKRESLADKRTSERQRDIEADQVMDEAQRLNRLVNLDFRSLKLAEQRREGSATLLRIAEEDLKKAGTASQNNVRAAQRDLEHAQWVLDLARATFLSDWSAFVSVTGEDPILNRLPAIYVRAKP